MVKRRFYKKIKKGTKIFSPCFWSCSKEKQKALNFIKIHKRNVLLIVNGIKNNNIDIDIDIEKISHFPDEKEVLVIPFCTFEIKNIKLIFDTFSYYVINLEYIDEKYEKDKLRNIPIYNVNMEKIIDKLKESENN